MRFHLPPFILYFVLAFLFSFPFGASSAIASVRLAGKNLSQYTIVYDAQAEPEVGSGMALKVQQLIADSLGVTLPIKDSASFRHGSDIRLHPSDEKDVFSYAVQSRAGQVLVEAGGCWAMEYAARQLVSRLAHGTLKSDMPLTGDVTGKVLFDRPEDTNFRILDDNIWDYSTENIPPAWQEAGIDCRDDWRAPQFAQMVRAYMPDVVMLQEYSHHAHDRFYPLIQQYGYKIAWESQEHWNNTPLFYDTCRVEMLESNYVLYTPQKWSNGNTKSYTSAVFRLKESGDTVACISTHLWWQSDARCPGSTLARAAQARLVMAEAEGIRQKYHCTIFVCGDMNCEENTIPIRQFIDGGYKPCYKAATEYGNRENGHHICSPSEVGIRTSRRKSPDREKGAIDHCFIYNATEGTYVQRFDCLTPYFTVLLTDHYPNLIDAHLQSR